MIIWLASYPKSGNTWVRSILTSLIYSKNGIFKAELLKKIINFPNKIHYKNLTSDFYNFNETLKYSTIAQDILNQDKKIKIFKTHHLNCKINNYDFTNRKNTLATIYIIRDPRNVITSIANHYSKSILEAKDFMFTPRFIGGSKKNNISIENDLKILIGTWAEHYNFWKKNDRYLLIKYENLINDFNNELKKIVNFLKNFVDFDFNEIVEKNIINTTSFINLQKIEDSGEFDENAFQSTGIKKKFFKLGPNNRWENLLNKNVREEIEKKFYNEMKELNYI